MTHLLRLKGYGREMPTIRSRWRIRLQASMSMNHLFLPPCAPISICFVISFLAFLV